MLFRSTNLIPGELIKDHLSNLGLKHIFNKLVFSDEYNICKPNPTFFGHVPSDIHIGDMIDIDGKHKKAIIINKTQLTIKDIPLLI